MITIEYGIQHYGRYNDDFYVICKSKEEAREILEAIRIMTESLKIQLNTKSQIVPFKMGLCYLGFHHYVTSDGEYIRKLRGDKKRKTQKKVRKWVKAVNDGKMSELEFQVKYLSCKDHMLHGDCVKLCHSMDLDIGRRMETRLVSQNRENEIPYEITLLKVIENIMLENISAKTINKVDKKTKQIGAAEQKRGDEKCSCE